MPYQKLLFSFDISRNGIKAAFLAYCILVLLGTLTPFNFTSDAQALARRHEPIEWVPFSYVCPHCGYNISNKIINLIMLMPCGFLLALLRGDAERNFTRIATATITGITFSLCIETAQYFIPARTPSASDLVLNTAGAFIGAAIACGILRKTRLAQFQQ